MKLLKVIPLLLTALSITLSCEDELSPVAAFNADKLKVVDGKPITFTNLSQNANNYNWKFGDGNTSTETSPTHIYELPGEYFISLEAIGPNGTNTTKDTVLVIEEINIFPKQGKALDISIGDPWSVVERRLDPSYIQGDEALAIPNEENPDYWLQFIDDPVKNMVLVILQREFSFEIKPEDFVAYIEVYLNYYGSTDKGISTGSSRKRVKKEYGEPEEIDTEYDSYYYGKSNVEFYFFNDEVTSIFLFLSTLKSSSISLDPEIVKEFIGKNRL